MSEILVWFSWMHRIEWICGFLFLFCCNQTKKLFLGCKLRWSTKREKKNNFMSGSVLQKSSPKNFVKFTGCRSTCAIIAHWLYHNVVDIQVVNFIKKGLQDRFFPANFAKFFRTYFGQKTSKWLLLVFTSEAFQNTSGRLFILFTDLYRHIQQLFHSYFSRVLFK